MKSPTFVSRPHFYLADESYLRQFQYGLRPEPEKHDSVFMIEPMSSIPLKVHIRLQLNVLLRKVEGIQYLFKNLQEVMFPVFWFESLSELPEEMAGPINMLVMLPTIMQLCAFFSLLISVSIIIFILIYNKILVYQKKKTSIKEEKHEDYIYSQVSNTTNI